MCSAKDGKHLRQCAPELTRKNSSLLMLRGGWFLYWSALVALFLTLLGISLGAGTEPSSIITTPIRLVLIVGSVLLVTWLLIGAQEVKGLPRRGLIRAEK
jgi:hypothetical protein